MGFSKINTILLQLPRVETSRLVTSIQRDNQISVQPALLFARESGHEVCVETPNGSVLRP